MKYISHSGVGRAIEHQMKALETNHIHYTRNKSNTDYDLVHINTVGPLSCSLAKKAKRDGKKVIMHAHSTEEDFRDSFFFANTLAPAFKKWLVHSYGLADMIITPTPYSKKIIDSYGIGLPCKSLSNGIDLDTFQYNEIQANAFRQEHGFTDNQKIVLSVGLQIKRKGIIDFIEIAKTMPHIEFVWCGHTSTSLMTKEVRQAINNASPNVHFLGYISNMVGAYSACDIFFMPTYEETEGIVVLEALAIKRPVILRDIPVYEDWLIHKHNCFKGSDNQEFKSLITHVLNHDFADTTEKGYLVVKERTLNNIGKELTQIYTSLLEQK
jgi:1,2-diacylglycerol-3-alpha-glucose alpha-1,2-glucosyltransferase